MSTAFWRGRIDASSARTSRSTRWETETDWLLQTGGWLSSPVLLGLIHKLSGNSVPNHNSRCRLHWAWGYRIRFCDSMSSYFQIAANNPILRAAEAWEMHAGTDKYSREAGGNAWWISGDARKRFRNCGIIAQAAARSWQAVCKSWEHLPGKKGRTKRFSQLCYRVSKHTTKTIIIIFCLHEMAQAAGPPESQYRILNYISIPVRVWLRYQHVMITRVEKWRYWKCNES